MTARAYPNYRWRKYLTSSIARAPSKRRQKLYAHFLCRQWYGRHAGALPIQRLQLIRVRERTVLRGPSIMRRTLLWQGECPRAPGPAADAEDERAGRGV
jgi:hypothetical protein